MPLYALPPRFSDPVSKPRRSSNVEMATPDAGRFGPVESMLRSIDNAVGDAEERSNYFNGQTNPFYRTPEQQQAEAVRGFDNAQQARAGSLRGSATPVIMATPKQSSISQEDFGNPMSRFRQVFQPGLTNQERQRRMQRFEGYDQGAAVREGLLGQERVRGQSAVDAAKATAQGGVDVENIRGQSTVEAARVKGQSDVASALAGQADTNRDGVIDPKERLALAEKWAKLDQARLMDPLDGSETPQQRPALPGEEAFAKMIQDELAKGQVRENPTNTDGFDAGGAFPDMNAQPPRGRVTQLPRENQAVDAPRGIQNSARPTPAYVDRLRQLRNDPNAIAAFEQRFGRGSAAQYLN